jgi:hypothetical protein
MKPGISCEDLTRLDLMKEIGSSQGTGKEYPKLRVKLPEDQFR